MALQQTPSFHSWLLTSPLLNGKRHTILPALPVHLNTRRTGRYGCVVSKVQAYNKSVETRGRGDDDDDLMDDEERIEWRNKIRQVMEMYPNVEQELSAAEKQERIQRLLADYPLVVDEEDPEWPEDADGRGFNMGQFFDKISIKNVKKVEEENNDDNDEQDDKKVKDIVWQDDDCIRPIKDISGADWEEAVMKDISPLIVLVHNRYRRPKENENVRSELEKAVHVIWNCGLPSPRCVAVDAVVEHDLVSALKVTVFPEIIFAKAGKILYREKASRGADELSKIMAFFYYGGSKPQCLNNMEINEESLPLAH